MSKFKKIFVNILAGLLCVLSLGTMTSCIDIPGVTVSDEEINVYRDGVDAYVYNGERYIHTKEMDELIYHMDSKARHLVGFAYDGIGRKCSVYVSNEDTELNVIMFANEYYFDLFSHNFYVKESITFPSSALNAKYSKIAGSSNAISDPDEEMGITFILKEVLSFETISSDLNSNKVKRGLLNCYLSNLESIYVILNTYLNSSNDKIYVRERETDKYYEIIDEEFKKAIMSVCFSESA